MVARCPEHGLVMSLVPSGVSKKTNKPYKAFYGCPNYSCKRTAPATNEEPGDDSLSLNESKLFAKELEEEKVEEDEYRPPKRKEWAYKEFTKGLSIISSDYRSEGMSPMQAVETGNLWQWMDFFYKGEDYYDEWKDKKRKVYMEILQDEKSDT